MKNILLNKRGQGTLEFSLTMIITIVLLYSIVKIWFWANNQIVNRQLEYNDSRVIAGTALDNYNLVWPVYKTPELKEEDVILEPIK